MQPTEPPPAGDAHGGEHQEPPPGNGASTASPAINSITVDPDDGTLMVGSGPALFRLGAGREGGRGARPGQTRRAGTVSGNLVLAFAGPGDLLASGHPQEGSLPENLGLIRSSDHGDTWSASPASARPTTTSSRSSATSSSPSTPSRPTSRSAATAASRGRRGCRPRADRRRRRPGRPAALGGVDRAGHVHLHRRRRLVAAARHDVRRAADLAERTRSTASTATASSGSARTAAQLGGPRRRRRPAERGPDGRKDELLVAVVGGKVRRSSDGGKSWGTSPLCADAD